MPESSDPRLQEALPGIERELAALRNVLALLGLKQCLRCRKYVRFGEPGALFDSGQQLVCYGCTYAWWTSLCPQLPVKDRSALERKLVHWLIHQHHARVIKQAGKFFDSAPEGIRLTADCIECSGAGRDTAGAPCSHCNGLGIVWVLLTERQP
jgi:hypothetical protein